MKIIYRYRYKIIYRYKIMYIDIDIKLCIYGAGAIA